jgi:hypothetical protein
MPINPEKLDFLLTNLLVDIRDRLEKATALAKGAAACAEAGGFSGSEDRRQRR